MSDLPDPPVPVEVDLQDFPFMPLQVARLRDSELAAMEHPEACWYAVLLWAASWHQIPAGSLPDNDTALMRFVGLGRDDRTWKKHRAGALRGFVQCSDGRLYHPVVVEQVKEAWLRKLQQGHRTFCAAIRKHNERNPDKKIESPSFEQWEEIGCPDRVAQFVTEMSRVTSENVARDNGSNRQGQGQGQGQGQSKEEETEANASAADAAKFDFDPAPRSSDTPQPPSPPDPQPSAVDVTKIIFDTGRSILAAAGQTDPAARSIIGRWRKTYSDSTVLAVLARCQTEGPSEPVEWITMALQAEQRRASGNGHGNFQSTQRRGLAELALDVARQREHPSPSR